MQDKKRIIEGPRSNLTAGEQRVLELLDSDLPKSWEIYVQPHLNGRRPDFILLHPNVGIAVLEVKDWMNFDRLDRQRHDAGPHPGIQIKDPAAQLLAYKKDIYEIYCPRLAQRSGLAAINAGLVFPFSDERLLDQRFSHKFRSDYDYVIGKQTIETRDLKRLLPASQYSSSKLMSPELADDLRSWLIEPDHESSKLEPLRLDARQRNFASTRTETGYRRIKGPAGSGKSLVVASRAAQLSSEGKSVLVVTYNITLISYLRELALRAGVGNPNTVTWINFHELCRNLCEDLGLIDEYYATFKKHRRGAANAFHEVPALIRRHLEQSPSNAHEAMGLPQFDAVLVDEGQDYTLSWWQLLRHLHKENGEMLLVADTTQDLYETADAWIEEEMPGSGFSGPWATLDVSYRLPAELAKLADKFSRTFIANDKRIETKLPPGELALEPCSLRWVQCRNGSAEATCVNAAMQIIAEADEERAAMTDMTILVGTKQFGREVQNDIEKKKIRTLATFNPHDGDDFDANSEERRRKIAFQSNRPFVKLSTIHSFKGWEAPLMVLHIERSHSPSGPSAKELSAIYAALTRLKRDPRGSALTVVCEEPTFANFGRSWPSFAER